MSVSNWETRVICQLLLICYLVSANLRKQPGLKVFTMFNTSETCNCELYEMFEGNDSKLGLLVSH